MQAEALRMEEKEKDRVETKGRKERNNNKKSSKTRTEEIMGRTKIRSG